MYEFKVFAKCPYFKFQIRLQAGFLKEHPALQTNLDLNDQYRDLISNRLDLAIRMGTPSSLAKRSPLFGRLGYLVTQIDRRSLFWRQKPSRAGSRLTQRQ